MELQALAYPGAVSLISFLAFSSQYLFANIEPGPLRKGEAYVFNTLIIAILICCTRTCLTDPGKVPKDCVSSRYCRRCEQPKAPRSHHCKSCNRCVPKMDHHCAWTANCVSHITLPHFVRWLSYSVVVMSYLEYALFLRCEVLWDKRNLPSYLGPTVSQLVHLFILIVANSITLLSLSLLLVSTIWGLATNVTTIEGWEIERHHSNLRRARALGGFLPAPDGSQIRIERQEYPWDIGILRNICQGMGSRNPVSWIWPFARSPSLQSGLVFEHNGIEDPSKPWPPPDPDRMFRAHKPIAESSIQPMDVESFKSRQAADRQRHANETLIRRRPFAERHGHDEGGDDDDNDDDDYPSEDEPTRYGGEEAWTTREGERLADFGVDEDVEFYDEDDLPLSELVRRRQQH